MGATKLYVIMTAKKIHCLNHITGPVTTPTEMSMVDALSLVKSGFEVYEVNPYNKKERVRVTPYNYNSIIFKTTLSDMIARKRLNRELQSMDKDDTKKEEVKEVKKEEPIVITPVVSEKKDDKKKEDQPKKDDSKKENDKKVETEENKHQKISHTDFEKH